MGFPPPLRDNPPIICLPCSFRFNFAAIPALPAVARPLPLTVSMVTRERVESVLSRVRPYLQADGGDIVLLGIEGNSADVRLTGMCAGCPSAHMTLSLGVETALRDEIPGFETLRQR